MGKVESKISESFLPYENFSRTFTETNNRRYSGNTNLSIFSSSLNIVKSPTNNKKNNNLSKCINSKQIIIDTQKILISFIPSEIAKYQNLCLISTTLQHTLKENCVEIDDESKDKFKDDHHIDIFVRGFLKFINIFGAFIESKLKKVMEILKIFKKNNTFQKTLIIEQMKIKTILSNIDEENEIDLEPQSSDRKSRNLNSMKDTELTQNGLKYNEANEKNQKKINIKEYNNNVLGKNLKKKNLTHGKIMTKSRPGSKNKNFSIEENAKKYGIINSYAKKNVDSKNNNEYNVIVSPEKRKNYSTNKVMLTDTNENPTIGTIEFKKSFMTGTKNAEEIDIREMTLSSKRDDEPLIYKPKLNVINAGFNKNNRLVKSVAKLEKNSIAENSKNDSIAINSFCRSKNVKSSLGGKEKSNLSLQKNKRIIGNQSMQQGNNESRQNTTRIHSTSINTEYNHFNTLKRKNENSTPSTISYNNNLNSTILNKGPKQSSLKKDKKISSNLSNKSTIDLDDNKFSAKKSDNLMNSYLNNNNINKINNFIVKQSKDTKPQIVVKEMKKDKKQTNSTKIFTFNEKVIEKTHRKSQTSTVHQLNVKININNLNQHQTNNNTINNIYDTHKKKTLKIEKEVIPEEKENYSSPDSTNSKLITLPNKYPSNHKNESSNSDSDNNIEFINNNRHNTPVFNHLYKRSNSSADNPSYEFNKNKTIVEKDLTPDEKFSFRGSALDNIEKEEGQEDYDINYTQMINYIVPRIGSVDNIKKNKENMNVSRFNETVSKSKAGNLNNNLGVNQYKSNYNYEEIDIEFLQGHNNPLKNSQISENSIKKEKKQNCSQK